ncbi:segregation/condensation protein A [bacterium]|nr:segregation/condensation protein A [bacterium]
MSQFKIKTEVFEGPLDLLLHLIEKRKFFINDISLSQIADDFIAHVKELPGQALKETAHFVFIASTLVLMKSRSLLPNLPLTSEEEGNIKDLKRRLTIYARVKELARYVSELFGARRIFPKGESKEITPVFSPSRDLSLDAIFLSARNVVAMLPKPEKIPEVQVKKLVTLEEMMSRLVERIQKHMKMSFRDFAESAGGSKGREARTGIIVSFLALLELIKRGVVAAAQENHFENIEIESQEVSVPRFI